jgi:molybdate transport system substrate-binding protein
MMVIKGVSSMAMQHVLVELAEVHERRARQRVEIVVVSGIEAARRVQDGEVFDFVVLAADAIKKLADGGAVEPGSRADLARSGVAIAVAAGAPRPDIGSEAAVRDSVLKARSIGYSTGPSGVYLVRLFERWGIAETIASRLVQAPPGVPVGALVARGEVELGFQQLSELLHLPGIDVIGALPPEVQVQTVFSAAVCIAANDSAAAKAFLTFVASPEADATKRRHGMEPA